MRAHLIVDSTAVRYKSYLVHYRHEIVKHAPDGAVHLGQQQALDDPVRVPVVELAESTAGHDHGIRHVDYRIEMLVDSHVVPHLPAQQFPDEIEIGAEFSQLVVLDVLQELGIRRPIGRIPVLELVAGRLERVIDEFFYLVFVRRVVYASHKGLERRQRLVRRSFHFHVDEVLGVLVHAGHLYRVQQIAVAVYLAEKAWYMATLTR